MEDIIAHMCFIDKDNTELTVANISRKHLNSKYYNDKYENEVKKNNN